MNWCVQIETVQYPRLVNEEKVRRHVTYQYLMVDSKAEAANVAGVLSHAMRDSNVAPGVRIPTNRGYTFLSFEVLEDIALDYKSNVA